jgi:hypothetical protein
MSMILRKKGSKRGENAGDDPGVAFVEVRGLGRGFPLGRAGSLT